MYKRITSSQGACLSSPFPSTPCAPPRSPSLSGYPPPPTHPPLHPPPLLWRFACLSSWESETGRENFPALYLHTWFRHSSHTGRSKKKEKILDTVLILVFVCTRHWTQNWYNWFILVFSLFMPYPVKRLTIFPAPAGMSLTKLFLDENNQIITVQEEFGKVLPGWGRENGKPFLQCKGGGGIFLGKYESSFLLWVKFIVL
jgi:hypothetical protein